MKLSELSTGFLFQMVQGMYKFECSQTHTSELMTDKEMMDFYMAYMGASL